MEVARGTGPREHLPRVIATHYAVVRTLGTGSFGQVLEAVDTRTGALVAIKLEDRGAEYPQLLYEARILEELDHEHGFPELYWFNTYLSWNVLVMPLLGRSLEADRLARGGCLPWDLVENVARQGLDRLRTLHRRGYAYRDMKPENFVWNRERGRNVLYLIDFGLSKRVIYPGTSDHIGCRQGRTMAGTPRYASICAHAGEEQVRRDDLESFAYMLVFLAKGELPWQRLPPSTRSAGEDPNFSRIGACKRATPVEELCAGLPPAVGRMLLYARECPFTAMPDYEYLDSLWG